MKKVTLFFAMIVFASFAFAQKSFEPQKYNLDVAQPGTELHSKVNKRKAPGDVLFEEDFDGADWSATSNNGEPVPANAPSGWELGDFSGNGFYFRWDTVGPRGIFSNPEGSGGDCSLHADGLNSTTGANGFMMLEADHFNSAADCSQYFEDAMDSYVEYNAGIDLSDQPAVHLIFEQANRMCCGVSGDNNAFFTVSTDGGTTWSGITVSVSDASNATIGSITGGPANNSEFDISSIAGNESNVMFRFHMKGVSHYHWEIDDVMLVAPENNDMQFLDYWNDYTVYRDGTSNDYPLSNPDDFTEGFYEYPWFLMQEFKGFHAAYINFGGQDQTNFVHNIEIWKDGEIVESFATGVVAELPVGEQDTTMLEATVFPWQIGEYKFVHYPSTTAGDDIPSNDTLSRYLSVSDTVLKVCDFTKVDGSLSPDNWTSYDEDGDGIGFFFNLPEPSLHDQNGVADYYVLDGAYLYIASNRGDELPLFETEAAKVVAGVYRYNEADDSYTQVISSAEQTLTINDTSSIVYIPFAKDGTAEYVFQGGDYVLAFNMYGTWTDPFYRLQSWNVLRTSNNVQKNSIDAIALINSSIASSEDVGTAISPEGPAIALRLTYTELYPNSINEITETLDFSIYPNPSKGTFYIDAQGTSQVTIMNIAGQVIDSRIINGNAPISIDVVSGVYFVRVENGNKIGTKRLIVE
ncbi:MAG: hypothetical protein C0599_06295 [Salinivirgaceae bacterium]|nr:MAG: hypothetical protein C0599_06295 [Salinivirgaceae bacterium]